ncbi:YdaU family protein, partial [Escherichia coli]|uniref:YdaU family protein n=1 Tax=Escherichia coli TaxID=562 RepID=UPI00207B4BD1
MAALPYMQLYIADYLADTMHLSAEEHGAYLLLMFNYWQTGKPIPKNRLAKIARLTNERWADVEPSLREFFHDNGDEWVHLRIEEDLWICPYISRHLLSLNPLQARCRRYSRGER